MDPPVPAALAPIASGPFSASLESLSHNTYPDWFTHGKLGIWAHWGPQSVPMEGDWYARLLYEEGGNDYKDHLARYGHPSKTGYKDLIPLWKAEKWDPDRLMALYKRAGAKYFVSMGVHHDNFDLWNSTYHRWNAVKMGPHRDVVGTWQKAALKNGLHFGVSEHLGASFTWFQGSHSADKHGALAGVPYDGADPAYEDLYHEKALPGDTQWYSNDPRWHAQWYRRIKDLIDQYHPELLYSDGGIPFGPVGEQLVAHFYNSNIALHGGKQTAVYNCKQTSNGRWVQDLERGVQGGIQANPWQTDTSIGDWFYNKHWKYRGADWVIHTLVDVVSKNGNLLINVVQPPDGSLDPEPLKVLDDMAAWMKVNSESIYDTTPWVTFGEGPVRAKGGMFKEDFAFTAKDIRYAQRGDGTLYATSMGSPSGEIVLTALARTPGSSGTIQAVHVLGMKETPKWDWKADGLHVQLPDQMISDIAVVLKISGKNLRGFSPTPPSGPVSVVHPDAAGILTLSATTAQTHGDGIRVEASSGVDNIGYWDNPSDWASWSIEGVKPGLFNVVVNVAAANGDSVFDLHIRGQHLHATAHATGSWSQYEDVILPDVEVKEGGRLEVALRAAIADRWKAINVRKITFTPAKG